MVVGIDTTKTTAREMKVDSSPKKMDMELVEKSEREKEEAIEWNNDSNINSIIR